jgi:pimeloyl-ACP methyl ester carboxylesterase
MKTQQSRDGNRSCPRVCDGELVVLVHGIWMTGLELIMLSDRLRHNGFITRRFYYPSLKSAPADNADSLYQYIRQQQADRVHLVAHSLGGIVLLHLFDRYSDLPPGRLVLMGSPVRGSQVARRLAGSRITRMLLGRSGERGLLGGVPEWRGERELGVISGYGGFGAGSLLGGMPGPGDGTVAVAETCIAHAADSCLIPTSHTGMVVSSAVAREVSEFLKTGRFSGKYRTPGGKNGPNVCPDIPLK